MRLPIPRTFSTTCRVWLLAAGLLAMSPGVAQTVLKGKDLTEKNLIEALSPPAADAGDEEVKLRSIRVTRDQPSAKVLEQSAKAAQPKPSASVLITFVTNSSELTARARAALDVVGQALQANQLLTYKFVIEGHADPRGNHEDNMRLSQARAESVVEYLVARHGLARDRLSAVGKGDTELYNKQEIDAPENRRVTIVTVRE